MKRFHRGWTLAIIALDHVVLTSMMQVAHDFAMPANPARAAELIQGCPVNYMLLMVMGALRYSRAAIVWSAVCSMTSLAGLGWYDGCLNSTLVIHIAEFAFAAGFLLYAVDRQMHFARQVKERDALARFLPAPLVERVRNNPLTMSLGGHELEVTVLFADIRGFTALAGAHTPPAIVAFLNTYFTEMVEEIFSRGGVLDKFIGDGICAVFTGPPAEQVGRALACGAGMLRRLESVDRTAALPGAHTLRIGIGVHTGRAVAGNIGSPLRLEYTHIGDAVNVASRIESLCKEFGEVFLVSADTMALAEPALRERARKMAPAMVKGKAEPLEVYALDPERAAG